MIAEYTAPWGRYRVHRELDDQVVLHDVASPSAFVVVSREKLAREYKLAESAPIAHRDVKPENVATGTAAHTAPEQWRPPPARRDQPETLGAPIPRSSYHVPTVSHETGLYWIPCMRRFEGEPHCWFVSEGAEVLCPACRGDDRKVTPPAYEIPPPLDPATATRLREVGAELRTLFRPEQWGRPFVHGVTSRPVVQRAEHRARNPEVVGSSPTGSSVTPPIAELDDLEQIDQVVDRDVKPENVRCCADCGKRLGVAAFGGEHGFEYCGACVTPSATVLEIMARGKTPAPASTWKPRDATDESADGAKGEVGSFKRPPPEERAPKASRETTRELWGEYTKEAPR